MRKWLVVVAVFLGCAAPAHAKQPADVAAKVAAKKAAIAERHLGAQRVAAVELSAVEVAEVSSSLTIVGADLVYTVTGLVPGTFYSASFVIDTVGCIGHSPLWVKADGTITFLAGTEMANFVHEGWTHVDAMLQEPGAPCGVGGTNVASFDLPV